jgi:hypothetical protein
MRASHCVFVALFAFVAASSGAQAAALPATPSASEASFVSKAAAELAKLYPTPAAAEKAGYFRYTDEDDTGAISYVNLKEWTSTDAAHPSQLWYDRTGRLLGADYSVAYSKAPPHLLGMAPARWSEFTPHVHYGLVGPNGTTTFGATDGKKFVAAGGSIAAPTKAQLVAAGIAKSPSEVRFVFPFPHIWDLEFWVLPNPKGAFAEKNPNVHTSGSPMKM